MNVEVVITGMNYSKVAKELMENFPEYSLDPLYCIEYDYDRGIFRFQDDESDDIHTVTVKEIELALPMFMEGLNKKWFFDGLSVQDLKEMENEDDFLCSVDAYTLNGILQLAIFKEIIYG